jgi:hypothetical protein
MAQEESRMSRLSEIRERLEKEVADHPDSGDHVIVALRGYDLRHLLSSLSEARKLLKRVQTISPACGDAGGIALGRIVPEIAAWLKKEGE